MNGSPIISNEKQNLFQRATLTVICMYAVTLYVGYIHSGLLRLQGLTLYAMVGLMLFAVLWMFGCGNGSGNDDQLINCYFIDFKLRLDNRFNYRV